MRLKSFRVAPSAFAVLSLAAFILTGCGGSSAKQQPDQTVNGPGFVFSTPAGWDVTVGKKQASASHGDELLQVSAFPLLKPYSAGLFTRVEPELRSRMADVAQQTGGRVTSSATVTTGGIRSHSYEVTVGDHIDEYTFVLRGMREFQLLCRRKASSSDDHCQLLLTSFRTA
jgi:hypothetical protein